MKFSWATASQPSQEFRGSEVLPLESKMSSSSVAKERSLRRKGHETQCIPVLAARSDLHSCDLQEHKMDACAFSSVV